MTLSAEYMPQIAALRHEGLSTYAIAKRLGLSKNTTSRALARSGLGKEKHPQPEKWPIEKKNSVAMLWNAGVEIDAIALAVGATRNAVISLARRMRLPRRAPPRSPKPPQRTREQYLADLAEKACVAAEKRARLAAEKKAARPQKAPTVKVPKAKAPVAPKPVAPPKPPAPVYTQTESHRIANAAFGPAERDDRSCCWPVNRPGRESFRYCNAPRDGHRVYCEAHRAIAYQRRVEAA